MRRFRKGFSSKDDTTGKKATLGGSFLPGPYPEEGNFSNSMFVSDKEKECTLLGKSVKDCRQRRN